MVRNLQLGLVTAFILFLTYTTTALPSPDVRREMSNKFDAATNPMNLVYPYVR